MATLLLPQKKVKNLAVPGLGMPFINWTHPLATALVAAPYAGGGASYELVSNQYMAYGSATTRTISGYGAGVSGNAINTGVTMNVPPKAKVTGSVSLYWRGVAVAAQTGTASCGFIGTSTSIPEGSPPVPYGMFIFSTGSPGVMTLYYGGTSASNVNQGGMIPTSFPTLFDALITANAATGLISFYKNGVLVGSSASTYNGTQGYTGTSTLDFCTYASTQSSRSTGVNGTAGYIWNRVLSAAEAQSLSARPYQFLTFSDDAIASWGPPPIVANSPFFSYAENSGSGVMWI